MPFAPLPRSLNSQAFSESQRAWLAAMHAGDGWPTQPLPALYAPVSSGADAASSRPLTEADLAEQLRFNVVGE